MAADLTPRQAYMVLNGLPSIGPISLNRLLDAFDGDPVAVLSAGASDLRQVNGVGPVMANNVHAWPDHFSLEKEEKKLAASGARFLIRDDPDYPPLLREIHDPPIGLYALGDHSWGEQTVAIVGARRSTLYGQAVATTLRSGPCPGGLRCIQRPGPGYRHRGP